MVEPKENKYDYSIVNSILQFVNKYNLKPELLWFNYEYGRRFILPPDTLNMCFKNITKGSAGMMKEILELLWVINTP